MSLLVTVDVTSPVPAFEQVRARIATLISTGALAPGQRLPTVRQLARDLDLAPGTVARAFRELEQAGLVRARGARGTVVGEPVGPAPASQLPALTTGYLAAARSFGFSADAILAAVRDGLAAG